MQRPPNRLKRVVNARTSGRAGSASFHSVADWLGLQSVAGEGRGKTALLQAYGGPEIAYRG
jgi:hypothetical protein